MIGIGIGQHRLTIESKPVKPIFYIAVFGYCFQLYWFDGESSGIISEVRK